MKVVEIRQEAELQEFRAAWETLLRDSSSDTIFLTWTWATAWWSAYGTPGELRILAAFDQKSVLRGIAPLRLQTVRRYGQAVSALSFIGDGSNDSEYLDFMIASGYEKAVMESFSAYLKKEMKHGTVLLLNEIPETSPSLAFLRKLKTSSLRKPRSPAAQFVGRKVGKTT
jgi:hypothetical protein